ncbi:hypothetical protein H0E87_009237 [Populus deltoides]|uniref:Uncharacterized protein n=1 Tax=Populus deltoides TaxID=3696 RepID=A0A8T2Z3K2_POPDE|nr:hypothetical protein H0E87_009237 [Populus deltoides]
MAFTKRELSPRPESKRAELDASGPDSLRSTSNQLRVMLNPAGCDLGLPRGTPRIPLPASLAPSPRSPYSNFPTGMQQHPGGYNPPPQRNCQLPYSLAIHSSRPRRSYFQTKDWKIEKAKFWFMLNCRYFANMNLMNRVQRGPLQR